MNKLFFLCLISPRFFRTVTCDNLRNRSFEGQRDWWWTPCQKRCRSLYSFHANLFWSNSGHINLPWSHQRHCGEDADSGLNSSRSLETWSIAVPIELQPVGVIGEIVMVREGADKSRIVPFETETASSPHSEHATFKVSF